MTTSRRRFLQSAAAVTIGFSGLRRLLAAPPDGALEVEPFGFGPLRRDPQKLLDLPDGFSYRILSHAGERMDDGFRVPGQPDGMGAFAGPDGRVILIRNHELDPDMLDRGPFGRDGKLLEHLPAELAYDRGFGRGPCIGGTTTIVYDPASQSVERQFLSLACTKYNCAGGPTPWGTWISCEETTSRAGDKYERDHGYAFEVPARANIGLTRPVPLKAMGRFRREAVAVCPRSGVVYQSEDLDDGAFYRFVPDKPGELVAGGRLQALSILDHPRLDTRNWSNGKSSSRPAGRIPIGTRYRAAWIDLDNVEAPEDDLRQRAFSAGAARFARAEGVWYGRDAIYFACTSGGRKKLGQVWRYVPSTAEGTPREATEHSTLELFIEPNDATLVQNCDNLTVAPWGDLVLCEDNDDVNFIVGVTPDGRLYKLARNAANKSEFAGSVFSPDGSTLFANVQNSGLTLAITGPWPRAQG